MMETIMWVALAVVMFAIGGAIGDIRAWARYQPELRRLRLVRERVVEFAVRATKEREMTLINDGVARQIEHMGRYLLEVVEMAERGE